MVPNRAISFFVRDWGWGRRQFRAYADGCGQRSTFVRFCVQQPSRALRRAIPLPIFAKPLRPAITATTAFPTFPFAGHKSLNFPFDLEASSFLRTYHQQVIGGHGYQFRFLPTIAALEPQ